MSYKIQCDNCGQIFEKDSGIIIRLYIGVRSDYKNFGGYKQDIDICLQCLKNNGITVEHKEFNRNGREEERVEIKEEPGFLDRLMKIFKKEE